VIGSLLIISGAFGIYRKKEVLEVGGYSGDTDTEDLELVVRLHKLMSERGKPYRIVFVPDPVCWTEAPENLRVLARQRIRWHRGLLQTLWRHKSMFMNPRYGAVGLVGFPYLACFELLGPFVETLGYVAIVASLLLGALEGEYFVLFLAVAGLYGVFLSVAAVLLEEISFRRYPAWIDLGKLLVYAVLENVGYRQLLSLFKVQGFFDALRSRRTWGRMDRTGFKTAEATRASPRP
jgi:cellulose synthase/poly-beta-1,6-N-acetylglucosamine synthase-like glycosyltransferase